MTQSKTIREYLASIPPENTATRSAFGLAGFLMAVWASMVPFVKISLDLDEAHLGGLLLCVGLGALVVMPFCGGLVAKRGAKFLLRRALFLIPFILFIINFSTNVFLTAILLFFFGMVFGSIDVAMNVHAVEVDRRSEKRLIMNVHAVEVDRRSEKRLIAGFHALYSLGSVLGALGMAALLNAGIQLVYAVGGLLLLCLLLWLMTSSSLLPDAGKAGDCSKSFVIPKGFVLCLGLICLLLFMIEGAVLDWGGVFLVEEKNAAIENAGLAFAAFSTAMTLMRLLGDKLIVYAGPRKCVRYGSFLGALMLIGCVVFPQNWIVIGMFFILGIGLANVVPIAFASTADQKEMPMSLALAAVTTLGYTGQLAGPALIGFVAKMTSLSVAFSILALFLVIVGFSSNIFRKK